MKEFIFRRFCRIIITRVILLFMFIFSVGSNIQAQNGQEEIKNKIKQSTGFIENKGQIIDQNGQLNPEVKFLLNMPGINVQLKSNSFSYDVYNLVRQQIIQEPQENGPRLIDFALNFHRVDIGFIGANPSPMIITEEVSPFYHNYYTPGTTEEGVTFVKNYGKITYRDLYPGIDLVFIARPGSAKPVEYSFIIHPGADISQIRWNYNGSNAVNLNEGIISIRTSIGELKESIPGSWDMETGENHEIIYEEIEKGIFGFSGSYNHSHSLVIDPSPTISWATYYGGTLLDAVYGVTFDKSGNVCVTGTTTSTTNIATAGAHQSTYSTGSAGYGWGGDAFIAKLTPAGSLLWGTYYGGSGNSYNEDNGRGIVTNDNGDIYMEGLTTSQSGIATSGSFQASAPVNSKYGIPFLVKFNAAGVRQWGTYFGDSGNGGVSANCIAIDASGNVYIAANLNYTGTTSTLTTAGCYQATNSNRGSGNAYDDCIVAKFSPSGSRIWATFYGGYLATNQPSHDDPYALAVDDSSNVYITGKAACATGISTTGAYQATKAGTASDNITDAFIAKINNTGTKLVWATYYGGTGADIGFGITVDHSGNVYVAGQTATTGSTFASTGAYQTGNNGSNDGFLAKFSPTGMRIWGTYFGGTGSDILNKISLNSQGDLIVSGSTASTTGIATTGSYQNTFAGTQDGIIAKFNSSTGYPIWSSYFGGSLSDAINSNTLDTLGNICVVGNTLSTSGVSTTGAFQTVYGGGNNDGFIAKFQDLYGQNNAAVSKLTAPGNYFCAGNQDVKVEIMNAGFNVINNMNVNWTVNGVAQTPVSISTPLTSGSSRVVLLGNISFPINSTKTIKVWTSMPNGVPDTVRNNDTILAQRRPGLNGTYTIGGSSPDYATFAAAINDLNAYGICGNVNFMVRTGTYNERIKINQITGVNVSNKVVFKGADKNSTILTSTGTGTADMQTVVLNGADQVTFRDMTISNTGTTYGNAIWLTSGADSNRFLNLNVFVDTSSTATNIDGIIASGSSTDIATDGTTGNYNVFDSVYIKGGYYGMRFNGPNTTTQYSLKNSITNCTFMYQYQYGIYLRSQSLAVVSWNLLYPARNTTSYGIYLDYSANLLVNSNNIMATDYGMYLNYINRYLVTSGFTSKIYNNMITSVAGYAFYDNQSYLLKIWHNSFSSEPAVSTVRFAGCQTTDLVNNHIQNRGTILSRYALQSDNMTTFGTMDYNNYFSTGSFIYIGSVDYGNLPVFQAAFSNYNQNSYNQDPLYFSTTDLHTSINLTGVYLGIDEDIDGDFRNTISPVLGADEVNIPNNSGISKLLSPVPAFCAGIQDVIVKIGNYGINNIDSVTVNWRLNGVLQNPVKINTMIPVRGFADVILGTTSFTNGESKKLKIWTSMPNGIIDPLPKNDTLNITVKTGLSGTYTVGGTSPDFGSLTEAISALNELGVCSPVVFNVRAGTYNERLVIGSIRGASDINTITFKGSGKNNTNISSTGTSVNDWATIIFRGADHFIFRDMTVSAMGTSYGIGMILTSGADSNSFINMTIQVSTTSTSINLAGIAVMSSEINMYAALGRPGDYNLFDSLEISGGYYGIYLAGNSTNLTISHCTLSEQYLGQIDCSDQSYLRVFRNTTTNTRSTVFSAINITSVSNFEVYANNVNLAGSNGIYIQGSNVMGRDTNFRSVVYNNMVSNTVGYPFYCENSAYISIWHNSIRSVGTSASYYAAVYIKATSNIDLRNNQIRNDNPNSYALYADFGTFDSLDYNNYYSFGNFVVAGNPYSNLSALKSGLPQYNQNSYSQNPQFFSITNLHTSAYLGGIYVGVNEDIDGESRCPSTVSVGADDKNWGFAKPVITTNHTNYFTHYPIRFSHNLSGVSGVSFKWFINGSYINDSNSLNYTFNAPGSYKISLQAERCISRDSSSVTIQIVPGNHMITLNGKNPDSVRVFNSYSDPGAVATDMLGSNITNLITAGNNIDTAVTGTYYFWYKVEDSWGNSDSITRNVVVMDDIAPIVSITGTDTITLEVFQNINDPGATVTDNYDTGLIVITDSSQVNINEVGIYKVVYSSTDHSGNTGTAIRWIRIVDTGLPLITLIGSDTVLVDVFSQYYEPGAKVTDNYCKSGLQWQVDFYPPTDVLATYTLTYTATDCQGNAAVSVKRIVKVVDRQKPVINLKGSAFVYAERWTSYVDSGVYIDDNYYSNDTLQKLLVTTNEVEIIEPGIYNVCYDVTDPSGNKAVKACRMVQVRSTTGLDGNQISRVSAYPNPSQGTFTIDLGRTPAMAVQMFVYNSAGKEIKRLFLNAQKTEVCLDDLANGVYHLKIADQSGITNLKLNIIR